MILPGFSTRRKAARPAVPLYDIIYFDAFARKTTRNVGTISFRYFIQGIE